MYISAQKMKWNTYNCWVVRLNKRLSTLDEHVQKQPEAKWKTKLKKKKQKVKKNKNKDVQQTVHSKLMRYNTLHSSVCVSVRECGFLKITAKKNHRPQWSWLLTIHAVLYSATVQIVCLLQFINYNHFNWIVDNELVWLDGKNGDIHLMWLKGHDQLESSSIFIPKLTEHSFSQPENNNKIVITDHTFNSHNQYGISTVNDLIGLIID